MKGNQVRASAEGTGLRQMDLVRPDLDLSTEYMAFIEMCTRKLLHPSSSVSGTAKRSASRHLSRRSVQNIPSCP